MRVLPKTFLMAVAVALSVACDQRQCLTRGSQVVFIGDSYLNDADGLAMPDNYVELLARADLSLGLTDFYRNLAKTGAALAAGQIPAQLDAAITLDPDIRLVVMNGGGNDILLYHRECLYDGSASDPGCQLAIQEALDAAHGMMQTAANANIRDVIYVFYPHIVPNAFTGPDPNEIIDYAAPLAQDVCDGAYQATGQRLRCHFIDLRPAFAGKELLLLKPDGIHPSVEGALVIGEAIWSKMQQHCIAQGPSSGCCR